MEMKHAYLIIAHHQFGQLSKLVGLLDHQNNDLYIHIDKKSKGVDKQAIADSVKHSKLTFVEPISIHWGTSSQIRCELLLLEQAIENKYDYYHLISGADLPLKPQSHIHAFFEQHRGKNFIAFVKDFPRSVENRAHFYYIRSGNIFLNCINRISTTIQMLLGVRRNKDLKTYKGSNWFSITHEAAKYITDHSAQIKHRFSNTLCADEIFLQTYFMMSPFAHTLYKGEGEMSPTCRLILWANEKPIVFRSSDYQRLIENPNLFARKFSEDIDAEIIEKIYNTIKNDKPKLTKNEI